MITVENPISGKRLRDRFTVEFSAKTTLVFPDQMSIVKHTMYPNLRYAAQCRDEHAQSTNISFIFQVFKIVLFGLILEVGLICGRSYRRLRTFAVSLQAVASAVLERFSTDLNRHGIPFGHDF